MSTQIIRSAVVAVTLCVPAAASADACRIYSGVDQTGTSYTLTLPVVDYTNNPNWFGSSSTRRTGPYLDDYVNQVYLNGESIRLDASESDVVLYAYTGDWMVFYCGAVPASRK